MMQGIAKQAYPESLNELIPDFFAKLPNAILACDPPCHQCSNASFLKSMPQEAMARRREVAWHSVKQSRQSQS